MYLNVSGQSFLYDFQFVVLCLSAFQPLDWLLQSVVKHIEDKCTRKIVVPALKRVRRIREKRLLASSFPSVCPNISAKRQLDGFPSNIILGTFFRNPCTQIADLLKFGQRYRTLCIKTDGTTKCFVGGRQCRRKPFLCFHVNSESSYVVNAPCCSTTIKRGRIVALPLRQWLRERAIELRYTLAGMMTSRTLIQSVFLLPQIRCTFSMHFSTPMYIVISSSYPEASRFNNSYS